MAQQVKESIAKPGWWPEFSLSDLLIEEENWLPQAALWMPHAHHGTRVPHVYALMQIKLKI